MCDCVNIFISFQNSQKSMKIIQLPEVCHLLLEGMCEIIRILLSRFCAYTWRGFGLMPSSRQKYRGQSTSHWLVSIWHHIWKIQHKIQLSVPTMNWFHSSVTWEMPEVGRKAVRTKTYCFVIYFTYSMNRWTLRCLC